ncbi:helix-turn-helix domain-containing protein [Marihabitans asiaticum]|uniref:DNA-binding PucR family transcriptional regulator n=1 Tax=Marihabitans asiaticum TaxID=415218 RepID=A0A560W9Q6_9MICO|nr:PucR family transcriptional regulator [Marihabitans asiaticum]TWD14280.1 DNA-binding PucR family transcriptional regulator [Marihabitans asiaticum]
MSDIQEVVDEVSTLLGVPVTLEDRQLRLLAFAAQPEAADPVRTETILGRGASAVTREWFESFGIATATTSVRIPGDPQRGTGPRVCLPLRAQGRVQGYLWAIEGAGTALGAPELERALELGSVAAELLARQAATRRHRAGLLHELLAATRATERTAARALAEQLGVQPETGAAVMVLTATVTLSAADVQGLGGLPHRVAVAGESGAITALVPVQAGREEEDVRRVVDIATRAAQRHASQEGLVVGVGAVHPLAQAAASHRQAQAAAQAARLTGMGVVHEGSGTSVARWDDLGVYRLLGRPDADLVLDAARTPAVSALLQACDPELIRTARTYLDLAGSVARTATSLGLHRQSVYARLARIEQITGRDLSDGRDRLELHLGLALAAPAPASRPVTSAGR